MLDSGNLHLMMINHFVWRMINVFDLFDLFDVFDVFDVFDLFDLFDVWIFYTSVYCAYSVLYSTLLLLIIYK